MKKYIEEVKKAGEYIGRILASMVLIGLYGFFHIIRIIEDSSDWTKSKKN
jgi:hypothetical protein